MKFFTKQSDGGKDSGVTAYTLFEIKGLASVMLLRFSDGTREAFHSHAFNAVTLWVKGTVVEERFEMSIPTDKGYRVFSTPKVYSVGSLKYTSQDNMHRVRSRGTSWALTFRGPWKDTWQEFKNGQILTLTHGRKVVSTVEYL